jgi:surface carbohydrate biosynthesis protein
MTSQSAQQSVTPDNSAAASRPTKIALIVDVPSRDLAGLVLTAIELCQRGASCYLVPASPKESEIWSIQPDFVVLNYYRKGNDGLAKALVRAGISFGVLDTEGIWPTPQDYSELLWEQAGLRSQARCVCMWGTALTEHVLSEGILNEDQVTITGCPRFDFYHPSWRTVLSGNADAEDQRPPRILVNTTCYFANPRFAEKTKISGDLGRLFGWDEAAIERIFAQQREALERGIDMIRRLARDFEDAEVIVRPHPYESPDFYSAQLSGFGNVRLNRGGPVQTEIARASVVIQRSCTTGIEAMLAGVPTLSPKWLPAAFEMPMAEAVSVPCDSYDELREAVKGILEGRESQKGADSHVARRVTREWFYRIDGLAHRRVSDTLLQSVEPGVEIDRRFCGRRLYGLDGSGGGGLAGLGRRVRHLLNLPPDWSFRSMRASPPEHWSKTDQFFDASAVRDLAERIQACRRAQGLAARKVEVRRVRERQDHRFSYRNYSVRLACTD